MIGIMIINPKFKVSLFANCAGRNDTRTVACNKVIKIQWITNVIKTCEMLN